jgi:hypothetical protein
MSVFCLCGKSFNEDRNHHQCTIGTALRAEAAAAHGHVAAAHFRLGDGVNLCGFLRMEDYLFSFILADGGVISKGLTLMGLNNYMCAQFLTLSPGCLCFSDGPF